MLDNMNREMWLTEAMNMMKPLLNSVGLQIPECTKVSCGFPGNGSRKIRTGECWVDDCQIFISPIKSDADGPNGVLSILLHELLHVCLPAEYKHNKEFQKFMTSVGLEGKPNQTFAGENLINGLFKQIINKLGPYPHIALEFKEVHKKSNTRLLKMQCPNCEFSIRITKKWIDSMNEKQRIPKCWLCETNMKIENNKTGE